MQPWMRYRAKEEMGNVGMAAHFLRAEDRRLERLRSVKSVLSSSSLNKLHPAAEKCLNQMEHLKSLGGRLHYHELHGSKTQPENSQTQHRLDHSAERHDELQEDQGAAPLRRRRRRRPSPVHHRSSAPAEYLSNPTKYTMYKEAPKNDFDYIMGLDARGSSSRNKQDGEEGNASTSLASEKKKTKKKKSQTKNRKERSDESVGDDILNNADELMSKEEMSQVSALDLVLKHKLSVTPRESDHPKEQKQKPKKRRRRVPRKEEEKSFEGAPKMEEKAQKGSVSSNEKEVTTKQQKKRSSTSQLVLPAVVERKTLVGGGCPRCSAEENCSIHKSPGRILRKSTSKTYDKKQEQVEGWGAFSKSGNNPNKTKNVKNKKRSDDYEDVRSLVEEVRRLDPEARAKVLQAVRSPADLLLAAEKEAPEHAEATGIKKKHAQRGSKDSILSEEVLSGCEDGEQGRKGRIYLNDGSYVSTTQSKDSPQTPSFQTVEQEDKNGCDDEANYSDEDFHAEPQEERPTNADTDHYHSDFED